MPGNPAVEERSATFIVLSFARPQNIQRILDEVRQADCCGRVILSNNNPEIDILDHIAPPSDGLEVRQQKTRWDPIKRFLIARETGDGHFICIDDDVFLTAGQIDRLFSHLVLDPSRPHGIWGELYEPVDGEIRIRQGVRNMSCRVSVLNRVYAFTRDHVVRMFELMESLGIADPRDLKRVDDVLLSAAGAGRPQIHDLGPIDECPTSDQAGIALWREDNFHAPRLGLYASLQSILEKGGSGKPAGNRPARAGRRARGNRDDAAVHKGWARKDGYG